MKKGKLTFHNFRGLDRRTTQMGTSPSAKPTDVGFEEMYGLIKDGVLHPLPAYTSVQSGTGRLFEVGGEMYFMSTAGVKKRNGSSFATFITHTFNNAPEYRDIKPFFDPTATCAVALTYKSSLDQSITVTQTLPINKYVNKHVIIGSGANSQTLYITGSDEHTIYTDGLINGDIIGAGVGINVYDKVPDLIVYDGDTVHRFDMTGSTLGTADTFTNGFIEVFANRLFLLKENTITFSTINSSIFKGTPFNYINTEGTIVDKQIIGNVLVVFTTNGTYGLTGTGFTTMNFPKISEFAPHSRVYPCAQIDNTYIIWNGYVRRFTTQDGLLETQYNYPVIPDTQSKIFAIERGVIFPLGHGTTKYGILNVEELQNRKLVSISNFYDSTITDLLEYKGVIYIISGGVIYKQSGVTAPNFKLNTFRMTQKTFWDNVEVAQGGNYPATITAVVDGVSKTLYKNDGANQVSYPIRDMGYAVSIAMTATDPITSFNIYYKI